jgi:hypothetical protein
MPDSKPWFTSKTVWSGILTGLAGLYSTLGASYGWPAIPSWITTILGVATVYGRTTADKTIG